MTRPVRTLLAAALVLVAGLSMLFAASGIRITYYLPAEVADATHTTTFEPALRATIVAGAATLVEVGVFVHVAWRRPAGWVWWLAGIAASVAVAVAWWSAGLDRPDF